MKVRRPQYDFSQTSPHWAASAEFSQFINAASFPVPWLERFLNKTMAKAAARLDAADPKQAELRQRIRLFIRQEANHYAMHERYNAILTRAGYDLAEINDFIISEYDRLWEAKSFAFCLAYCEGFETLGPPLAKVWLDEIEDLLVGANPEVVSMWKWHLAEEFEHRMVAFDAFHAISGSYFLRIYGFYYQLWHLTKMNGAVLNALMRQDWAGKSNAEIKSSRKRLRKVQFRMGRFIVATAFRVMSPWYTPRHLREPSQFAERLRLVDLDC